MCCFCRCCKGINILCYYYIVLYQPLNLSAIVLNINMQIEYLFFYKLNTITQHLMNMFYYEKHNVKKT